MREANGGSSNVSSALETITAAASAIASAESRTPQATAQKTRWRGWRIYWCFGSQKNAKRITHAVSIETSSHAETPIQSSAQPPLSAMAPPSSPASFFQSEPPSATLSPIGLRSLAAVSDRPAMFTVGPYAHETQLVSPPVFSAFTTEPSTAPFTPPPECIHLTTPSSPEVPFAKFLEGQEDNEMVHDYRVSFEICYEDVIRGREREPSMLARAVSASFGNRAGSRDETRPIGFSREFHFDSAEGEGHSGRPSIGSDWWANAKGG